MTKTKATATPITIPKANGTLISFITPWGNAATLTRQPDGLFTLTTARRKGARWDSSIVFDLPVSYAFDACRKAALFTVDEPEPLIEACS